MLLIYTARSKDMT